MKETFENTSILGVRVDLINLDDLLKFVLLRVQGHKKSILAYVNVHAINIAYDLGWFKDFINHSQAAFCDGYGVKWAVNFLNGQKLMRFSPPDWFDLLAEKCAEEGISMFFLGTRQEIVEKAAFALKGKHPQLKIAGVHHGFFDKATMSSANQDVMARINMARPDILVVGFGMPAQEKWILENWGDLQVKVALPVGALFDYLSGEVNRAPRWMANNGLEWLGRLLIEPGRLWRRYVIGIPLFLFRIFIHHYLRIPLPK